MNYTPKQILRIKYFNRVNKGQIRIDPKLLTDGNYHVIATSYGLISNSEMEILRRYITRRLRGQKFKLHARFSINHPHSAKAVGSRMGHGVGNFYKWYGYVKPGQVLFTLRYMKLLDSQKFLTPIKNAFTFKTNLIGTPLNLKYEESLSIQYGKFSLDNSEILLNDLIKENVGDDSLN